MLLQTNSFWSFSILSTLLLSSISQIDLASLLLSEQIRSLLFLFNSSGAGLPENGPFAPLVLAQPGNGTTGDGSGTREERLRAKIARRIQFCFAILNAAGVDRGFCAFFGKKMAKVVGNRDQEDKNAVELFLHETFGAAGNSTGEQKFNWDSQTKTLFKARIKN